MTRKQAGGPIVFDIQGGPTRAELEKLKCPTKVVFKLGGKVNQLIELKIGSSREDAFVLTSIKPNRALEHYFDIEVVASSGLYTASGWYYAGKKSVKGHLEVKLTQ